MGEQALVLGKIIGRGGYGTVYHAKWGERRVAVKKFAISREETKLDKTIQEEIGILEQLKDRYIIQFYGTTYLEGHLVLIMEYAEGGSLNNAILRRQLDWPSKRRISQEIARGLDFIHSQDILHRDLKSANVLLTKHQEVRLCDFGLAAVKGTSISKTNALQGTPCYLAPELLDGRPKFSTKSDMYALGMVMWEMAANSTTPFRDKGNHFAVMMVIINGGREELPNDTPEDYRKWVERCWNQDPEKRPEACMMITDEEDDPLDDLADPLDAVIESALVHPTSTTATLRRDDDGTFNSAGNPIHSNGTQSRVEACSVSSVIQNVDSDYMEAQFELEESSGTSRNYTEAAIWYRKAAEQGDAEAQYLLGKMYLDGTGVEQNNKVIIWIRKVADQGNADSQTSLGILFSKGIGVVKDESEAFAWFLKAAKQGNSKAQCQLGLMYLRGQGVQCDASEALKWIRKSADQDDADGLKALVGQSDSDAFKYYLKSTENGGVEGMNSAAKMYSRGRG
ncbi:hypothetical protein BGW41_004235, partial [Actinomortierella wolfii]